MPLVYDKLWCRLAEKDLKKTDLLDLANISRSSLSKLSKNDTVTTDTLDRICEALGCDIGDIAAHVSSLADGTTAVVSPAQVKKVFLMNSFFAGIGGFDIAFERHGFKTEFLCEINDFCCNILEKHWPTVTLHHDICELDINTVPQANVWCGGFPCQDISVARGSAERKGLNGSQSGLFYRYADLISQGSPEVVIIENVEGLLNSNGGRDFGVILQRMSSMGYAIAWRLLNSRYFGVPQSRPRVYICCWLNNPMKALTTMFDHEGAFKPPEGERKDFITEAEGAKGYPKVPKTAYCLAATSGRHTGTDWSRTYVVCSDGVRRMTPKEYERLQGFPDGWTIPNGMDSNTEEIDTLRYKALGNAVSVPVVEWIASRVYANLADQTNEIFDKDQIQSFVPEFSRSKWSETKLSDINFTDAAISFKWEKAGIVWNGNFIAGNVYPAPADPALVSLINYVEKEKAGSRYYLTSNAAEGILRRVESQGRKLFEPLRVALEKEKKKVKSNA